jgi:hypothetical protein
MKMTGNLLKALMFTAPLALFAGPAASEQETLYCDCGSGCSCDDSIEFGGNLQATLFCGTEDAPNTPESTDYSGYNVICTGPTATASGGGRVPREEEPATEGASPSGWRYDCVPENPSFYAGVTYDVSFETVCGE